MSAINPWIVQAAKSFEPLPVGAYMAKYQGVEDFELEGKGKWRWKWEVVSGEHKGKLATALTNMEINPNTLAGRIIAGMLGRGLQEHEDVKASIEGCSGKTYIAMVQHGAKGGKPQVQSVSLPPQM